MEPWRVCCSLHAVTSSVIYYSTRIRKNVIYLFYTIEIQMFYWRSWEILGAWKPKNKSADVDLTSSMRPSSTITGSNQWKDTQKSRDCIFINKLTQSSLQDTWEVSCWRKCQYFGGACKHRQCSTQCRPVLHWDANEAKQKMKSSLAIE